MIGAINIVFRRLQRLARSWAMQCPVFLFILVLFLSTATLYMAYFIHNGTYSIVSKTSFPAIPESPQNSDKHLKTTPLTTTINPDALGSEKQTHTNGQNIYKDTTTNDEIEREFTKQWFRMQSQRLDWRKILAPCADNTAFNQTLPGWGKENMTSLKKSYVDYMEVRPSGQFSRFFIRTKTDDDRYKTIGGDFWKVILFGPATVGATVFDHGNGSYEAIALIVDPGKYSLVAFVERSLCEGMKDPTPEFFSRLAELVRRKINGRNQKNEPGCCLNGRLSQIDFTVPPGKDNVEKRVEAALKSKCSTSCSFIWTGLGRWIEKEWTPFLSSDIRPLQSLSKSTQKNATIFFFGDSVTHNFASSYFGKKERVCDTIWKRCEIDFFHLYPEKSQLHPHAVERSRRDEHSEQKWYGNSSEEFKPKIFLDSLKDIFLQPGLASSNSLLVLNLNFHYARSISFAQYKDLIRDITNLLENREKLFGSKAKVAWRTTTALNYRKIFNRRWSSKYLTSDRALLFEAYALSELCKSGIDILDLYPMSMASPLATDRVHFQEGTFYKAMDALTWYAQDGVKPRTEKMCLVPAW